MSGRQVRWVVKKSAGAFPFMVRYLSTNGKQNTYGLFDPFALRYRRTNEGERDFLRNHQGFLHKKTQIKVTDLSRFLIYILAHRPDEFGLVPDSTGLRHS